MSDTPGRLNSVAPARFGKLSDQQMDELATWFTALMDENPDKVLPVPECYKPIVAWQQMYGNDIVNESNTDMKPWNMPSALIEYWADIWYASRVGLLRAKQRSGSATATSGHVPIFTRDKGTGRA